MSNLLSSFYDEENGRPQIRKALIIKKDKGEANRSRPGSVKQVRVPEILEKKVESLEKRQELWKEREQVWGKERKSLERALKNACKDPNEYYKNLLNNWHSAQKKIQPNQDSFYEKLEKLRGFLNWVVEQNGETPLKYIKQLAKEQFEYLDEIERRHKFTQEQQVQESSSIIDSLQKENAALTEKLTFGMQDIVTALQIKIQDLTNTLSASCKELEQAHEEKAKLKSLFDSAEERLTMKSLEIDEYVLNIGVLEEQIQDLKERIEAKKIINRMPFQEINENSQIVIEKLVLQLKDMEEENQRLRSMNQIFEVEVENLQKLKIGNKRMEVKKLDCFDVKIASTQTGIDEFLTEFDLINIVSCMARGLEGLLERG